MWCEVEVVGVVVGVVMKVAVAVVTVVVVVLSGRTTPVRGRAMPGYNSYLFYSKLMVRSLSLVEHLYYC